MLTSTIELCRRIVITALTELTFGDGDNFGIICSVDQELGLSVGEFIEPDVSCFFINNQPVATIANLCIPEITLIQYI